MQDPGFLEELESLKPDVLCPVNAGYEKVEFTIVFIMCVQCFPHSFAILSSSWRS